MTDYKNFAFWIMILFIIGLGLYVIHWVESESYKCVSDSYVYSIRLLEKANYANVTCTCTVHKQYSPPVSVLLDNKGFHALETASNDLTYAETNWTNVWENANETNS